jgi:hypothetical protein
MIIISIPFLFAFVVIGTIVPIPQVAMAAGWSITIAMTIVWLRLSLVLPAAAVGVNMPQHASWAATKAALPVILWLAGIFFWSLPS